MHMQTSRDTQNHRCNESYKTDPYGEMERWRDGDLDRQRETERDREKTIHEGIRIYKIPNIEYTGISRYDHMHDAYALTSQCPCQIRMLLDTLMKLGVKMRMHWGCRHHYLEFETVVVEYP